MRRLIRRGLSSGTSRDGQRSRAAAFEAPALFESLETRSLLSFSVAVPYNVGTQADGFVPNAAPINVVRADFNGDGKLDLVVSHKSDSSVYILLGTGEGTFQPAVRFAVGEAIEGSVFVGDFNNDGKSDLFLPGDLKTANHPIVLLGNGNGTFNPRIDSSSFAVTGSYPRGWTVGDFNGDKKLDVMCTLPSTTIADAGAYTVLLGNGDGTFKAGLVGANVLHYSRWSTTGDFNADGKLDIAVADGQGAGTQTGTAELTILLGNGDGTFKLGGHYASPGTPGADTLNPEDVFVADLNKDGKLDVVVSDYDKNINIFLGNGDGTVKPAVGYETGEYPRTVAFADVNGDGKVDLVVNNLGIGPGGAEFAKEGAQPGSIAVLSGNGDGTFQAPTQYNPVPFYPGWTAVGDFNGDGKPDLAVTQVSSGHAVYVMLNQPSSNAPPTVSTAAQANPNPVTGTTTNLSVLGADDGGEANLTYTWAAIGSPPAAVAFSTNGTNAAKSTTATFTKAGSYSFQVTLTDAGGLTTSSSVNVTVSQTLTSIAVSPTGITMSTGGTQQFTATGLDQFAAALGAQPAFTWTATGGAISSTGLFTAGATAGPFTVTAASGSIKATTGVTVSSTPTLTVFSTAGDGRVADFLNTGAGQTQWDAAHAALAGNNVDYTTPSRSNWAGSGTFSANGVSIMRGFLVFDTSALPANAVITSATLGVFVTGKQDAINDGNDFLTVVQGLQASPASLTAADYTAAGNALANPAEGSGRVDITGIPSNAFTQWSLNTTGLSWITRGGITKLAVREGHDVLNLWPAFKGQSGDSIHALLSEQAGTSQDPYLRVDYTVPAPSTKARRRAKRRKRRAAAAATVTMRAPSWVAMSMPKPADAPVKKRSIADEMFD